MPTAHARLLQPREAHAAPKPRIDAGRQLFLGHESTDVVLLQKAGVESFLTAERAGGEQRSPAGEDFRDGQPAGLADDDVGGANEVLHPRGPAEHVQAPCVLRCAGSERDVRRSIVTGDQHEVRVGSLGEQLPGNRGDTESEAAAQHEHDRTHRIESEREPRLARRRRLHEAGHERHPRGQDLCSR